MSKKNLLLGISSGIAAFKAVNLIALLKKQKIDVHVVMTKSAAKMVDIHELQKISGNKVWSDVFEENFDYKKILETREVDHIQLADSADLVVIAPATANTISKLAHGIADDFLSTTVLAATCPVVVFPSMNVHMWSHPATQANIRTLRSYGYQVIDPDEGPLACGYEGKGRLPEVSAIAEEIITQLKRSTQLQGQKVVITSGGTQEPIDQVRFITNKSSGKMGAALAEVCFLMGADVTVLRAETAVPCRYKVNEETFHTADDLEKLVEKYAPTADLFFHTAAVSDFEVKHAGQGKIKSTQSVSLELEPRAKIVNSLKKLNPKMYAVAFKAEFGLSPEDLQKAAEQKIKDAQVDLVVANDVSQSDRGFGVDTNEVMIIGPDGLKELVSLRSKREIAQSIVNIIQQQRI